MAEPITITATLPAWLFYFYSVDDLMAALKKGDANAAMGLMSFTAQDRSQGDNPYTLIGEAEITVTLRSRDQLVTSQLEALNKSLQVERAESIKRQNVILDRISKLKALTNEVIDV